MSQTIRGLSWSFLGTGGQVIISTIVVVLLARLLEPAVFGVVSASLVVVSFAQIFATIGVAPTIIQLKSLAKTDIQVLNTLALSLSVLLGMLTFASAEVVTHFFRMPELLHVLKAMSVVFPITGLSVVGRALLQRELSFRALASIELSSYVMGYGLIGILLASNGYGVWSLVGANVGQAIVSSTLVLIITRNSFSFGWNLSSALRLSRIGLGYSIARLANFAANQMDILVVGRTLGSEALGIYSRAYQFMMMPVSILGTVIDRVMFPALSSIQDDHVRMANAAKQALATVMLMTLPIAGSLVVIAPEAVPMVLGRQWLDVIEPLQILLLSMSFRSGYKIFDSAVRAVGAVYQRAFRQLGYALMVLTGAYAGQHFGDLTGVATGVAVAILLNFLSMAELAVRVTDLTLRNIFEPLSRHLVVTFITTGIAYGATTYMRLYTAEHILIILVSTSAAAASWLILWAFGPSMFGPEGAFIKNYITKRFPFRRRST